MAKSNEVWILVDSSKFGGIESHILELSTALVKEHLSVRVVLLRCYGPHPLVKGLNAKRIPVNIANGEVGFLHLAFKNPPAIIHTHGYKAGITGRLVGKLLGIKTVSTFHAGEKPKGRVAFYDWLDRYASTLADHVFAVSHPVAERIHTSSQVIENFVDTDVVQLSAGEQIAFVGRLSEEKGPDRFVKLASKNTNVYFHVYGDGPLADSLQGRSPANTLYHGQQKYMNEAWNDIGLLLITSRFEGLPMAAIEAMARGIPVIAFDVGALSKLIDHNKNGWLIAPGDLKSFQKHLLYWLDLSAAERADIRFSARKKVVNNFSRKAVIPKYLSCYGQLNQHALPMH